MAYLIVLLVATTGVLVVRRRMLGGAVPDEVPVVDPHLTAFVAGGRQRLALTVLSEMVDDGELLVDKRGRVTLTPDAEAVVDPLRQAMIRAFGGQQRVRASVLLGRARRQREMLGPQDAGQAQGLLYPTEQREQARLVPLILALVGIAGVPLLAILVSSGGPSVLVTSPLVVFALVGGVGLMVITPRGTPMGRAVVRETGRAYDTSSLHGTMFGRGQTVLDELPYALSSYGVAVRGSAALHDANLHRALVS